MYATSKSSPRGTNQSVFPKSSASATAAVAVAGMAPSSGRVPLPPVGSNALPQQLSAPAGSNSARAAALTYPNGRRTINLSQLQTQQQQQPVLVSSDADVVPWQKVHRGSIPAWEQERLLREVLAAMLLADNGNPAMTQSEAATAGTSRSLHNRATQAANDVVSEFVRSAIIGGGAGAFALNQQQRNSSGGADADALLLGNGGQRAGTAGSRPGSVSLTALRLPSTDGGANNNNGGGGDADEDQQWVANVRDRRQLQLERLLRDAQNEAALLKQQLDDITRAHDDTQRALNQAYHEYDKLQQSVLSRIKGAAAVGAKSSNDDAGAK